MAKPRISIVVPPSVFTVPPGWEFVLRQPFEGASYIATVMKNAGYPVRIIDARFYSQPAKQAAQEALDSSDIVCIATYEDSFTFLEEITALIKKANPDMPMILGGSLVTSAPEVVMNHSSADIGVLGEGEITILELLDLLYAPVPLGVTSSSLSRSLLCSMGDLKKVKGICYKGSGNEIIFTKPRPQMKNLDDLPVWDLSLWPAVRKDAHIKEILYSHSRGCYRNCSFCFRTTPKLTYKSVQKVKQELVELKKRHNFEFIYFVDLTWVIEKQRALELCAVIEPLKVKWSCMTRVQNLDKETLQAMKRSGCDIILYGFESVDQAVLDKANKGTSEQEIRDAINMTRAAGIRVGGLFIVGLPGETESSLNKLFEFTKEMGDVTRVKYLSAIPGTDIYESGLKNGVIKNEVEHLRWLAKETCQADDEFLNFTNLPDKTLRDAYRILNQRYAPGPRASGF